MNARRDAAARQLMVVALALPLLLAGCAQDASRAPETESPADDGRPPHDESIDDGSWFENVALCKDEPNPPHATLLPRTLVHGTTSGHHATERRVVENATAWQELWLSHRSNTLATGADGKYCSPNWKAPFVDWGTERVVAVWQGDRSDTCHAVRITNLTVTGPSEGGPAAGETRVEVTANEPPFPDPDEDGVTIACGTMVTQPHHAVAVAADGTQVRFDERLVHMPAKDEPIWPPTGLDDQEQQG